MSNRQAPPSFDSFDTSQAVISSKSQAPSFASFNSPERKSAVETDKERKRRRKESKSKSERSEKKPRVDNYQSAQAASVPIPKLVARPSLLETAAPSSNVFPRSKKPSSSVPIIVDSLGDPNNQRYHGLHTGDVPNFRREGGGRILGLHPSLRIIAMSSRKDLVVLPKNQHAVGRLPLCNSTGLITSIACEIYRPRVQVALDWQRRRDSASRSVCFCSRNPS